MTQFIVLYSFFLQDYISFIFLLVFSFVVFSFGVVVFPLFLGLNSFNQALTSASLSYSLLFAVFVLISWWLDFPFIILSEPILLPVSCHIMAVPSLRLDAWVFSLHLQSCILSSVEISLIMMGFSLLEVSWLLDLLFFFWSSFRNLWSLLGGYKISLIRLLASSFRLILSGTQLMIGHFSFL